MLRLEIARINFDLKMKRGILINLFIAFILVPATKIVSDYVRIEIRHDYSQYSGSFLQYEKMIASTVFILAPILSILLVLLPYNFVIIRLSKKRKIMLFQKILIFEFILIFVFCLFGTFLNIWRYPLWENIYYIIYFFPFSILFAGLLHYFVDKRTCAVLNPSQSNAEL